MSSFYFSSHREGPKPRGRPSFSHKVKTVSERRGRGGSVGRPLGRPAMREAREPHAEREYCFESEAKKGTHHFQRQGGEMPKHQRRFGCPIRDAKIEDYEDEKAPKVHEHLERKFSHVEAELGNKLARNHYSRPRDAPREKQRLTQDLARQKRLLSEDIARAELLQREQISKKVVDVNEGRNEHEGVGELSNCDASLDDMSEMTSVDNTKPPSRFTVEGGQDECASMYEKCYGSHPGGQARSFPKDNKVETETQKPEHERESLFERFLRKGDIQAMKSIEFVNENEVEVKGLNYVAASCETKISNSLSNTTSANSSSGEEHEKCQESPIAGNLEPLKFENVTDDELTLSDTELHGSDVSGSEKNQIELEAKLCPPNEHEHFPDVCSDKPISKETCPDVVSTVVDPPENTQVSSSEKNIFESFNCTPCECQSEHEQDVGMDTVEGLGQVKSESAPGSTDVKELEQNPDHSIIKTSKLDQLMAEPDMQCKHSSKFVDDPASEQGIASCVDYEEGEFVEEEAKNCVEEGERPVCADLPKHEPERIGAKENGSASESCHNFKEEMGKDEAVKMTEKETLPVALVNGGNNESELSNNEGMSDAGELSEPNTGPRVVRGKVKIKKRKKHHNAGKAHIKSSLSNPRSKVSRGKPGGKRGRKGNRRQKVKAFESDSDDNEDLCMKTGDSLTKEKEVENTGEEKKRFVPSTHEEGDKESSGRVGEESRSVQQASPPLPADNSTLHGDEKTREDGIGSSIVEDSEEEGERQELEEHGKKERTRKEKRLAARQKRKSEDKDKDRSTPPHLVSQNRFARDLPRHNWLVEQLLQQNKLCGDTLNNMALSDKKDVKEKGSDTEETKAEVEVEAKSEGRQSPETETNCKSEAATSSGEQSEAQTSPVKDNFQSELHKSFLRRGFQPSVPRAPPKLKPSTDSCSDSKVKPLPQKHKLSPKETPTLEPLPKLRKIVDEEREEEEGEPAEKETPSGDHQESAEENELARKVSSPIEILDDEEERKANAKEPGAETEPRSPVAGGTLRSRSEQVAQKSSKSPTLSKSMSFSPLNRSMSLSSTKRLLSSVSPKDHVGHPLHMPPHRAAILIPVVPVHDGVRMSPGLTHSPSHLKGYPPRTFTPHLLTHSSPMLSSGMFPNPLSPGLRYPGNTCMHHHMGPKSGASCKRDVNCPFHGNQPRGVPPGLLGISGHHPPIPNFGQHGHEHLASSVLNRSRHERSKSPCTHPDCKVCQPEKDPRGVKDSDAYNDKGPGEVPKVVKPIAHVPGKRASLMLPHLQQHGRPAHAFYRGLEELHEEKSRRIGGDALLSPPHKPGDKFSKDHMSPLHDRQIGQQPLTLSELNRRREEELYKSRPEEPGLSVKSKTSPHGDFIVPGLPSPSRTVHVKPHSKDSLTLSPGRSQSSICVSQADKRELPHSISRRIGEEKERSDYASYMAELLKSGPPRLRPLEDPRQKREELLMLSRESSAFMRHMSAKDPSGKFADGKNVMSRGLEQMDRGMRQIEDEQSARMRVISSHGNVGILSLGPRELESAKGKECEEKRRPNSREAESERLRNEQVALHRELGRRGHMELLQAKEREKREGFRGLPGDRERPSEFNTRSSEALSDKNTSFPFDRTSISPVQKRYSDQLVSTSMSQRFEPRIDPRMMALRELELQRRQENNRVSDASHRDMLSRMALSFAMEKGKPIFGQPDAAPEQSTLDPSRIRPEFRGRTPPISTAREFAMPASSRQALDRLAAAAGKSGGLVAEPRLKQVSCCTEIKMIC